jgi:hypothetical protein
MRIGKVLSMQPSFLLKPNHKVRIGIIVSGAAWAVLASPVLNVKGCAGRREFCANSALETYGRISMFSIRSGLILAVVALALDSLAFA